MTKLPWNWSTGGEELQKHSSYHLYQSRPGFNVNVASAVIHGYTPASTLPDPPLSEAFAPGQAIRFCCGKQTLNRISIASSPAAASLLFVSLSVGLSPWPPLPRLGNTCSCQISVVFITCLLFTDSLADLALGSQWQQQWWRGWQVNTGVCNLISFSFLPVFRVGFFLREMGERYRREMLAHGGAKEPMLMVEGRFNLFATNTDRISRLPTNICKAPFCANSLRFRHSSSPGLLPDYGVVSPLASCPMNFF